MRRWRRRRRRRWERGRRGGAERERRRRDAASTSSTCSALREREREILVFESPSTPSPFPLQMCNNVYKEFRFFDSKNRAALREGVRARVVVREVPTPARRRLEGRSPGRGLRRGPRHRRPLLVRLCQLPPELQVHLSGSQSQESRAEGAPEAQQRARPEGLAEAGVESPAARASCPRRFRALRRCGPVVEPSREPAGESEGAQGRGELDFVFVFLRGGEGEVAKI